MANGIEQVAEVMVDKGGRGNVGEVEALVQKQHGINPRFAFLEFLLGGIFGNILGLKTEQAAHNLEVVFHPVVQFLGQCLNRLVLFFQFTVARFQLYSLVFFFSIFCLICYSAVWFFNGGINGPIGYIFLMSIAIFVGASPSREYHILAGLVFMNLIALYALEYFNPHWITPYPDRATMYLDHTIT